jgi:hypothetical protein
MITQYAWQRVGEGNNEIILRYGTEKNEAHFRFPISVLSAKAPSTLPRSNNRIENANKAEATLYAFQGALSNSDFEGEYL